jgi:hypothetical protein
VTRNTEGDQASAGAGWTREGTNPTASADPHALEPTAGAGRGDEGDIDSGQVCSTAELLAVRIQRVAETGEFKPRHQDALRRASEQQRKLHPYAANEEIRQVEKETGRERAEMGLPQFAEMCLAVAVAVQP